MKTIAFFNNKGGVGKTSLVYHLSWMFSELGLNVIAVDLDPQANLTAMCLNEDRLEEIWPDGEHPNTVSGALRPLQRGVGDVMTPHLEDLDGIGLIPGDLELSFFEDRLSECWPKCLDGDELSFRVTSAFYRLMRNVWDKVGADLFLIDVGPNLGAINRAALISADSIVVPMAPDLFSVQGLKNLGPTFRRWRKAWRQRLSNNPVPELELPEGTMKPIGYVLLQHALRLDRPVKAYEKWMERIPGAYRSHVLDNGTERENHCLAQLKHYRSLMPMAMDAGKPMFFLKPGDGAIGAHYNAVQSCYGDFAELAHKIAARAGVSFAAVNEG